MTTLMGKLGTWELPHVHAWKNRRVELDAEKVPLILPTTKIATIGSCFAEELANAMQRLGLDGGMHPGGLFYSARSIRQELESVLMGVDSLRGEAPWRVEAGFVHPFSNYHRVFRSEAALKNRSEEAHGRARQLFRQADVFVVTLGLIETWRNPKTGNTYREIPHPEVFSNLGAELHRSTVQEMLDDLDAIWEMMRSTTQAKLILTVSPVPLHATMTPLDVRTANTESKSRIRAAVSEFIAQHPEVRYFHSYEIVSTAERLSDFMMEDGRHVQRHAVDYILQQFLQTFGAPEIPIPQLDTTWITPPFKTAARVRESVGTLLRRRARRLAMQLGLRTSS